MIDYVGNVMKKKEEKRVDLIVIRKACTLHSRNTGYSSDVLLLHPLDCLSTTVSTNTGTVQNSDLVSSSLR